MDRDKKILAFLFMILVGYGVRLLTFFVVFSGGGVLFLGADPYYHMRRAAVFPQLLAADSYMNYPVGAPVNWPPLYDMGISAVSFLVGFGSPGPGTVERVGAYFPVIVGLLSLVAVYFIVRKIFGGDVGLISVFVLALSPAHVQVSLLGFTDHHISEVLLSALIYLSFFEAVENGENVSITSFAGSRRFFLFAVSTGALMAASLLTWLGAPIFIGIVLIYSFVQFTLNSFRGVSSRPLAVTGIVSVLVGLDFLLLSYLAGVPWSPDISQNFLSWFQVVFLLVNLLAYLLLYTLSGVEGRKAFYVLAAAGVSGLAGVLLLGFSGREMGGVSFLLRQGSVVKQISESLPLFYTFFGEFTLEPVWNAFAAGFYTGIAGLALLVFRTWKNRAGSWGEIFFLVWTLVNFTLAFFQRRFIYLLSVNLAVLTGYLIYQIYLYLKEERPTPPPLLRLVRLRAYAVVIPLAVFAVVVVSSFQVDLSLADNPPRPSSDWLEAIFWLGNSTQPTSGFSTSDDYPPEYGVMDWWDYGNWIEYLSRRPVVANNFQLGLKDSTEFLTAENEDNASRIMDRRRARYVIVDHRMGLNIRRQGNTVTLSGTFPAMVSTLGRSFRDYVEVNGMPGRRYFRTMYSRLYILDGSGLRHYRLVYESSGFRLDIFQRPTRDVKIFEYVPGAKIKGETEPGGRVNLTLLVLTNQGRSFSYFQTTKADSKGEFNFTVPYSTRPSEGYEIELNNQTQLVAVSEDEVSGRGTILLESQRNPKFEGQR